MATSRFLRPEALTEEYRSFIEKVSEQARQDGCTIAQYALRWILRRPEVTSVIVGASSVAQLKQNLESI